MMQDKIVVTGIGLVTPLGVGREETWRNLIAGESGIDYIEGLPIEAVGKVRTVSDEKKFSRQTHLALIAAQEALEDAEVNLKKINPEQFACTVSVSKPDILPWVNFSQETAGRMIRENFKLKGPGGNYSAACATGLVSVKAGMMYLLEGKADFCIAGSSESSLNSLYIAGFKQIGVLAEIPGNPKSAIKPFDADRTGFLPGEGAGIFVLEKESSARERGAHIYGGIASCVLGNDGYHPVLFNANGMHIAHVIREAISRAGWDCVDYINAHGTATRLNDRLETLAIKYVFDRDAVSISSTKAGTGHLLGAAGSVETAFGLLAMRDGIIPQTLNLRKNDPECDLDYTPLKTRRKRVNRVLSLSYGFGGHIGAIALEAI